MLQVQVGAENPRRSGRTSGRKNNLVVKFVDVMPDGADAAF